MGNIVILYQVPVALDKNGFTYSPDPYKTGEVPAYYSHPSLIIDIISQAVVSDQCS